MKRKKPWVYDIILVLGLLLVALLAVLLFAPRRTGGYVVVHTPNAGEVRYPLAQDAVYPLLEGENVLVVKAGAAYMESATCPDGLCVAMGPIDRVGQSITCLPHRVYVLIE